jgi:hypothetical protein
MNVKPLVLGLLVVGCLTAAAGGAYYAVRQNGADQVTAQTAATTAATAKPVAESEAVVTPAAAPTSTPAAAPTSAADVEKPASAPKLEPLPPPRTVNSRKDAPRATLPANVATREPARPAQTTASDSPAVERPSSPSTAPATASAQPPVQAEPTPAEPPPPPRPQIVEVVIPASAVLGLQVENSISSETARVEDRVDARLTRDVRAEGQIAIPSGSKVLGNVILVERGGKMKDKARLGVRFHTVVLADGNHLALRTESIYREGTSPGGDSARKIGGATVGGAILGAIIGGAKGAAIGGATGAAGGSAVVMAGDRNPATLPAGTVVNVRLSSPVSVDVEKEQ